MDKRIYYPGVDDRGNVLVEALFTHSLGKTKVARVMKPHHSRLHPELQDYISQLTPSPHKLYVLVNALGAWEYYGQNINGDAFRESVLSNDDPDNGYRTFYKANVFRHHCFPAGTEILLADRRRVPIEAVEIGDLVETLEGPRPVTEVMRRPYEGAGVSLTLKGRLDPLVATEEHPVLVYRREQIHCRHKYSKLAGKCSCRENKEPVGDPEWVPIKEVLPGDYMVFPKPSGDGAHVSPEFAQLVGWVAAEGHLGARGLIQFTFGEANDVDLASVTACLEANGLHVTRTPRPDQGAVMLSACSKRLHALLSEYVVGVKSEKRLTGKILEWSPHELGQMLGAYIDGDGHVYKTGRNKGQLRIRSASRQMLLILSDVLRKMGVPCALNWDSLPREFESPVDGYGTYTSSGSGCVSVQAAHSYYVAQHSRKAVKRECRSPQQELLGDVFLVRVTDREDIDLREDVFNLEVEGPHHYIANEVVVHNCNKDPRKGFGRVAVSVWNPRMRRVELLLEIDRVRARELGHGDLIDALDNGENPAVSMGMRTPYDICLVCKHRSKTRSDYCQHVRPGNMGHIYPDGQQAGVDNPVFRAFDISFVLIGADQTSYAIEKVASKGLSSPQNPLRQLAVHDYYEALEKEGSRRIPSLSKEAQKKLAEILKQVPTMDRMQNVEEDLPPGILNAMAKVPLGNALSTAAAGGIVLKPHEFQRIVLVRMGRPDYADMLDQAGSVFAPTRLPSSKIPMSPKMVIPGLLSGLRPHIPKRSCFGPTLTIRLVLSREKPEILEKRAHVQDGVLDKISAAYDGYREEMIDQLPGITDFVTCQHPEILDTIYPDALEGVFTGTGSVEKTAGFGGTQAALLMGGVLPAAYLLTRSLKKAVGQGETEEGALKGFVKDHPLISASLAIGIAKQLAR